MNSKFAAKTSLEVSEIDTVEIKNQEILKFVSRAGLKLEAALQKLKIDLKDKVVLDVGQSTGGFTDCCLQFGASQVVGFDVGENQLHEKIKNHPKVKYFEKQNAKNIHENFEFSNSCGGHRHRVPFHLEADGKPGHRLLLPGAPIAGHRLRGTGAERGRSVGPNHQVSRATRREESKIHDAQTNG